MAPLPWDQYKDIIIRLYARHTLDEVVTMMIDIYQFKANARTYQKKFDEWGVGKRMNSRSRPFALMSDGQYAPTNLHSESNSDMTASVDVAASSSAYTEPGSLYSYMGVATYALDNGPYQSGEGQYGYGMNMPDTGQFNASQLLSSQVLDEHYASATNGQPGGDFASISYAESEVQPAGHGPNSTAATYQQVGLLPDNQRPTPDSNLRSHRSSRRRHRRSSKSNRSRD